MSSELTTTSKQVEEDGEVDLKPMETLKDIGFCRRQKRKMAKKLKRKQIRKEAALKEKEEEEARLNDEEEQRKLLLKEKEEAEMMERQRKEFEERERLWMERAAKKAQEEEEEARRKVLEEESHRNQIENENELEEDDDWEYVEEGPAEIIWQGNEIIVKKKRVKVAKKSADQQASIEDVNRPTSNPLPPQSEAYASYRNTSVSDQQVFESVSQQNPNFGTEQDKAHCPFHIKTGACRFGARCSRAHFYPDKSCTLLIKNMYNGPGLAWEQDEGLECTDEEIDRSYEEFYEDVHTEFLKFGEIVNFKVCKNGSSHLRGNVYVHYKSLESAILAYDSINGRYFAAKQITCEYIGVTRWRVAICGEYMKSRLMTCSRGTACNFIHCFRNPGGDYEWADWDNPPPKYWVKKMAALFGPSDEVEYDKHTATGRVLRNSKKISAKRERYHSRRSRSKDSYLSSSSGGDDSDGKRDGWSAPSNREKQSANHRKMRSSIDEREDDSNIEDKDTDRYYSNSRTHSHRHSKGRDRENIRKKSNERNEGKYRLDRKYDDLCRIQKRRVHDGEHIMKSEKYVSDSRDSSSGPNFSETVDPCDRWETGSNLPDETKKYHGENRSRSHSRSSSWAHSNNKKDEKNSREDHEHKKGKHKSCNEDNKACFSSGESRGKSDIEQKEACDSLKHKSGDHHRSSGGVQKDESKSNKGQTKRKHESIGKGDKLGGDSRKSSRSSGRHHRSR